ncbi:MAG: hypothetical protein AB7I33_03455 [Gemmatimonadales bacterium]
MPSEPDLNDAIPLGVTEDALGRLLLVMEGSREIRPLVFDSGGRFLWRLGKPGDGPGHYRRPYLIVKGRDDSLHVFDGSSGLQSVLGPTGEFVRGLRESLKLHAIVALRDGRFAASAIDVNARGPRSTLHFLATSGDYSGAFHEVKDTWSPRASWGRWLAEGTDGTIWTVPVAHEYRLEHWDGAGRLLEVLLPDRDWFRPYRRLAPTDSSSAPLAAVRGIWFDPAQELLWVVGVTADPRWREGLPGKVSDGRETPLDYDRLFDGVVDVFDPRRRTLVATGRFDMALSSVTGDGLLVHMGKRVSGLWAIDLFRARLSANLR